MMYQVSDANGHVIYLLPSIHMGNEAVYEMLKSTAAPYVREASALLMEVDLDAFSSDALARAQVARMSRYTPPDAAQNHLPKDVYDAAVAVLTRAGMRPAAYETLKVQLWPSLVEQAAAGDLKWKAEYGTDTAMMRVASEAGVPIVGMETALFQYAMLLESSDDFSAWLIAQVLDGAQMERALSDAIDAYLSGDEEALINAAAPDFEGLPDFLQGEAQAYISRMITARDAHFFDCARAYLDRGEKVVVMVGAVHVVGQGGLKDRFEEAGYTVSPL